MTSSKRETSGGDASQPEPERRTKRRYEKPRLVDYGPVSKLTQTGGITTRDTGSKKKKGL